MFPIGDSPNPRGIAWVTLALIVLNVGVFVMLLPQMSTPADVNDPRYAEYIEVISKEARLSDADVAALKGRISQYDLTVFEHGSRPAQWTWLTMLTSMFLHGGWMHLFGNMLFLWIYGNNPEHRLGRLKYLAVYLATGFAASFGDILLRPSSNIPGVGASGAISGVLGLYFIWFPRNKVRLLILMPPVVRRVDVGARLVLGFYIIAQNILPAILTYGQGGGGGVAHGAHIGGFIAGVVVALIANLVGRRPSGEERAREKEGLTAADAVHRAEALASEGRIRDAVGVYERALALDPARDVEAAARLGIARLAAGPLHQPTVAYQHVVAAINTYPSDTMAREAQEILDQIRAQVGTLPHRFI